MSIHTEANAYLAKKLAIASQKRKIQDFRSGDLICVHVTINDDNDKTRVQKFEGRCIGRHGGGLDATYTVWSVIYSIGVRRVFPLHAYDVEVIRHGKVRREKLNYFTHLRGKSARIKDRRVHAKALPMDEAK